MNLEQQQPPGAPEATASGRDVLRDGDNSLLAGAVDVHVHGYPDAGPNWPMRTDDRTTVSLARDCGMRGIVLKSHFWPTMDRARMLNEELADRSFAVHGSITLNPLIGGLQPETVEAAAGHGAKVVYLPTWGSANDNAHETLVRGRIIDREFPRLSRSLDESAISIRTANGKLRPEVREILAIAEERDLVVSTGHVSLDESAALAEASAEIGYRQLLFGHPFSANIGASIRAAKEIAEMGAFIELTALHTMLPSHPLPVTDVYRAIRECGAANVVISSDVYFDWLPPHVEVLRMFTGQLRFLGVTDEELRTMLVSNPARMLGLAE